MSDIDLVQLLVKAKEDVSKAIVVKERIEMGFDFCTIANDAVFITQSGSSELAQARGE